MVGVDHLEPDHELVFEDIEPEDVDFPELRRVLTPARWVFPAFLGGAFGTAGGIAWVLSSALGGWTPLPLEWGIPIGILTIVMSFLLARSAGRRVREGLVGEDIMEVLVHLEWRTGRTIFPSTIQWPKHVQDARAPPPFTESENRRFRLAMRIRRSRPMQWLPLATVAWIPIGIGVGVGLSLFGPEGLRNLPRTLHSFVFTLLAIGPLLAWVALVLIMSRLESRVWLLQEYERLSGRRILPSDIAGATRVEPRWPRQRREPA